MKKTTTAAISFPTNVLKDLDMMATEANISRSALVTVMASFLIKWSKEATKQAKKDALNSIYGNGFIYCDTDSVITKKEV